MMKNKHIKMYLKVACKILVIISALLCLNGCWDSRELNTLGFVIGVGLDKAETAGETKITLQFGNVHAEQSSSKSPGTEKATFTNVSNTGKTSNAIIRDFAHKVSRRLYLPHNQVIIFGKDFAAGGVRDNFDFFMRARETRKTLYVLVAKGRAEEVLEGVPAFEKIPASEIVQIMEHQKITSETAIVTVFDFAAALYSDTTSAVSPIIEIREEDGKKQFNISGCAVFKGDKAVGELNKEETRGYLWVVNKVKARILNVSVLGEQADLEIKKAQSKVTTEITDGSVLIKVDVKEGAAIGAQTGTVNLADLEKVKLMEKEAERVTREEIQIALNKAKEMGTDIFAFGDSVYRKYPNEWKTLKGKWDKIFKNIKVEINVEVKIDGAGNISVPLYPEKE